MTDGPPKNLIACLAVGIMLYEMPKLEQKANAILAGKGDISGLPEDEKWCMYMKYRHVSQAKKLVEELYRQEAGIMRAEKAVNGISRDVVKMFREYSKEKARLDRGQEIYNMKRDARIEGRAEGKAEGLAEGKAEGLVEGKAEGLVEGRIEIARKMLAEGSTIDFVQKITGLDTKAMQAIMQQA